MNDKKTAGEDYKKTLNLPQTEFPMRGSLPEREPPMIERWHRDRIYYRMVEKNIGSKLGRFLLHDGPPYANGNIHLGHALNKVLKDVVIKYKNMCGYEAPFVPGWDCHGLPIELGVEKQLLDQKRDKAGVPITQLREMCREYAKKYIALQKEQFNRLEVFGDWDDPYLTMDKRYVATIVRELGRCAAAEVLYKGNKPVHWCASCTTALAEAEIEYADKKSPSIYVKFDLADDAVSAFPELAEIARREGATRTSLIIWTTTPWTLPANLGISLHPEFDYVAIKVPALEGTEIWIVAKGLQESFEKAAGFEKPSTPLLTFKAERLHRKNARHPFINRNSLIMLGEHVTLDTGTGAVHTAPGHGVDDYKIGRKYGLGTTAPVDDKGKFTAEFPEMQGQFVFKTNEPIIEKLRVSGHLVSRSDIEHSYPHCWRCNTPVIFRATPQWFIGMEPRAGVGMTLRDRAKAAIQEVRWVPSWGINRIMGMVESRPDWCISRQRTWGVPITVFYCESCNEPKADQGVFSAMAEQIEARGVDIWFTEPAEKLIPPGTKCSNCQGTKFKKERDILDVWFDSGVSHAAVCEKRDLGWPADLYLEGSDQHRGWFQTSLLTGVATRGRAPFRTVLTHGFVNDKSGKKMSKSKGNVTSPLDLVKTHGAEILRLWVVLEDYRNDVNFSMESLERVSESYRKIRNTIRFLLGNLYDFNPDKDLVSLNQLGDLDRWALARSSVVLEKIHSAYESYEFHQVYQQLVNFCSTDLSAVYFDILKDRLYTAGKSSPERRSAQTAMWLICDALTRSIAPILSFTAEEIWGYMPKRERRPESVFLGEFPSETELKPWSDPKLEEVFAKIWDVREIVLKALEEARKEKTIGHPREAKVTLAVEPAIRQNLSSTREDLGRLFLVSELELTSAPAGAEPVVATVTRVSGEKCARCWVYSKTVGESESHPELCSRCQEAIH